MSAARSIEEVRPRPRGDGGDAARIEEDAVVRRAVAGERAAWQELYERHVEFVFRVAVRFLGDEAEARDVAHDVFVSVFARISTYQPAGRFRTYLYRVVANHCLNERARFRHRRTEMGRDEDALAAVPDGSASPEEDLSREQEASRVRQAIARLPERQRLAVILSRFEELSYEEIAAALETSVSSVESLLFRARRALVKDLGDD